MASTGRKRGRTLILLALILIMVLAGAVVLLRNQLFAPSSALPLSTPPPAVDTVQIIVLFQPVSRGTILNSDMLSTVDYPRASMIEGLFYTSDRMTEVVGKRTRFDLGQGTPVTPSLLTDAPAGSYAAVLIPKGMVALPIPISRLTSVAYALQPGDHVNVLGSILLVDLDSEFQTALPNFTGQVTAPGPNAEGVITAAALITTGGAGSAQGRTILDTTLNLPLYLTPSEFQRPRLVSQTLIQDAVVLWVGDFPDGPITTGPRPTPTPQPEGEETSSGQIKPQVLTLIVTPQDAVTLNYLMLAGATFNMALRGSGDVDRYPIEAVTLQFILDQYDIPSPAKLPYGVQPRIDQLAYPTMEPEIQEITP